MSDAKRLSKANHSTAWGVRSVTRFVYSRLAVCVNPSKKLNSAREQHRSHCTDTVDICKYAGHRRSFNRRLPSSTATTAVEKASKLLKS